MIGIIGDFDINERRLPSQQSEITGFYKPGDEVEIEAMVEGEEYDGESLWYRLKTRGTYLWAGGVEVDTDTSQLEGEDKNQFLLCFRQTIGDKPRLDRLEPSDNLTITDVQFPSSFFQLNLRDLDVEGFARRIVNECQNPGIAGRKHVFIYIHGFQLLSTMKLDLFAGFVKAHFNLKGNKIAKSIFFSWPAQGGPKRTLVDDRSIHAGQHFTKKGLFSSFETLSKILGDAGIKLNLIVHSFGHQLLNGMINPDTITSNENKGIFENIFLMASDVTHLALKKGGEELLNYFAEASGQTFEYNYTPLLHLAKNVHVFYDEDDFLLYVSTKKFVGNDLASSTSNADKDIVKKYRSLGNYGPEAIPENDLEPGFHYWSLQKILEGAPAADLKEFPFQPLKSKLKKIVNDARDKGNYKKVNGFKTLFNSGRFTKHHQYLFTCKPVVEKIQSLLS